MSSREIKEFCQLDSNGVAILRTAMERMGLSARAYDRILKVARTIADLNNSLSIEVDHLAEAIQYRNLDKGLSA
jgi:magnesium chelatase family protein